MGLSNDLISQFVKVVTDDKKPKTETTVYGTVVSYEGTPYVRLDGAEEGRMTPVSTSSDVAIGDRVIVMIKNHSAIITGNMSSPAARVKDVDGKIYNIEQYVKDAVDQAVSDLDEVVADKISTKELEAVTGRVEELEADNVSINEKLTANEGDIDNLKTEKLDSETAKITYANIDFSNIDKAAIEYFYSKSGLIENVVVGDGTITGTLVGVTIKGDLIEANTVVADKLVIQGEDGLYYKLNASYPKNRLTVTNPGYMNSQGVTGAYSGLIYTNPIPVAEGEYITCMGIEPNYSDQSYVSMPFYYVAAFDSNNEVVPGAGLDNAYAWDYRVPAGVSQVVFTIPTGYTSVRIGTADLMTDYEQTDYNSLNGRIITAKSITATQISVDDLVAFDATIGGFTITDRSIYSEVKDSEGNTTRLTNRDVELAFE